MAILNKDEGCVVLRIVYAGPPMSGKTESLRSLSSLLFGDRRVDEMLYSPDHTDGRTLYFDWLSYTGGYFRGYKVNCQLVSVPGQKTLKKRRKLLLEMADVVVFVVDSEEGKLQASLKYYEEMQPWLDRKDEPPVGVVIQANKRDSEKAIPIPAIYEAFKDNPNLLVLETIATKNSGIREAFVTGVRIGLERATWLINNDRMAEGKPELDSGDSLLHLIQSQESDELMELRQSSDNDVAQASVQPTRQVPELDLSSDHLHRLIDNDHKQRSSAVSNEVKPVSSPVAEDQPQNNVEPSVSGVPEDTVNQQANASQPETDNLALGTSESSLVTDSELEKPKHPNLPNKDVVAGSVFPPITGRIILHKLAGEEAEVQELQEGTWEATISHQWRLLSRAEDRFSSSNDARMQLVHYASTHKKLGNHLSEHRCLAIVESSELNEWRIWQIVRAETTLEEHLISALMGNYPHKIAENVYNIAEQVIKAYEVYSEGKMNLPFHFNSITLQQDKPVFTGYIPYHADQHEAVTLDKVDFIKTNFKPLISKALHDNPILSLGVPYVLHPLEGFGRMNHEMKPVVEVLRTMFIGEH